MVACTDGWIYSVLVESSYISGPVRTGLKGNPYVKELRLGGNGIVDAEEVGRWAGLVPGVEQLRCLDFSQNPIGDDGASRLASILPSIQRYL